MLKKEINKISLNLKKEVLTFLSAHPEWDLFTKIRWIYLKTCELFSYDSRYRFGDSSEKEFIYNRKLDICDISEFEIVCSTWCHLFSDLLALFNVSATITYDVLPHKYVIFKIDDFTIKADATRGDTARVKLGNTTRGYTELSNNKKFDNRLLESDRIIKYYKRIYTDECLALLYDNLKREGYMRNSEYSSFSNEQLLFKLDLIKSLVNNSKNIYRFDDSDYYFNYLKGKILTILEQNKVHSHDFWLKEESKWYFLKLILIELKNANAIYYKIDQNQNGKYSVQEIEKDELFYYVDHYEGEVKGVYRYLA